MSGPVFLDMCGFTVRLTIIETKRARIVVIFRVFCVFTPRCVLPLWAPAARPRLRVCLVVLVEGSAMSDGERAVAASPLMRGVSRARAHQWRVAVDVDASRYAGVVRGDDVSGCLRPLVTPESVRRPRRQGAFQLRRRTSVAVCISATAMHQQLFDLPAWLTPLQAWAEVQLVAARSCTPAQDWWFDAHPIRSRGEAVEWALYSMPVIAIAQRWDALQELRPVRPVAEPPRTWGSRFKPLNPIGLAGWSLAAVVPLTGRGPDDRDDLERPTLHALMAVARWGESQRRGGPWWLRT